MAEDFGRLTRTLPVAEEWEEQGHKVSFCNPARIPDRVVEEAGIENLPLDHPLMYLDSFDRILMSEIRATVRRV